MSDLLKLKFIADWDCYSLYECYRVNIEEIDDILLCTSFCTEDELDKNKMYTIKIGNYGLELTSMYTPPNSDACGLTTLINLIGGRFSYVDAKDIDEVLKALEMLKPEIEKYVNTIRDEKLEKEKRKELWLEKEPFDFTL